MKPGSSFVINLNIFFMACPLVRRHISKIYQITKLGSPQKLTSKHHATFYHIVVQIATTDLISVCSVRVGPFFLDTISKMVDANNI